MFKYIATVALLITCSLNAKWHGSTEFPEDGQFYMYVVYKHIEDEMFPIYVALSHFDSTCKSSFCTKDGWWDLDKDFLWNVFIEKVPVIYLPPAP